MNTQPDVQNNIEVRLRIMRTLWIATFVSIGLFFAFTIFNVRSGDLAPNNMLFLILLGAAASTTLISFPIKNRLLSRAVEQQQAQLVQQAYVVAWTITEFAAVLAVVDFFMTGDRYYYLLFIIAACGQLLHFPRREHLINASFGTKPF